MTDRITMTNSTQIALSAAYPSTSFGEVVRVRVGGDVLHRNDDGSWYSGAAHRLGDPQNYGDVIDTPEALLKAVADMCQTARTHTGGCLIITQYDHDQDPTLIPEAQWPTFTATLG